MRQKITQRCINQIRAQAILEKRDQFLWDTYFRGFGVKCSANGHVSFVIQKYVNNKSKRITVGHHPWLSLKQAQKEAAIIVANLYLQRNSNKTTQNNVLSSGDASKKLEQTYNEYYKRNSTDSKNWYYIKICFENHIIPYFGKDKRLTAITRQELRKFLDKKQNKAPQMARLLHSVMRAFFNWCVEREYLDESPLSRIKPPKANKSRDRYLSRDEIKVFWNASLQLPKPYSQFYRFALLTGQRNITEIAKMKWCEIDFTKRIWTIPASRAKNNKEHLVYLSDLALEVLSELDQRSSFVFSSTGKRPISDFSTFKDQFDRLSKLENFKLHDLRRTMSTHMAEMGVNTDVADRILNHVSGSQSGIKGVYQRYEFLQERNEALQIYGEFVREIVK